jgi:hypothetical protein
MDSKIALDDEEIPRWDVALEALAGEEFRRRGRPLQLADFETLARDYAIRLDDIMITLFELVIQGRWNYCEADGTTRQLLRADLDPLYVNGRLRAADLRTFDGHWTPA